MRHAFWGTDPSGYCGCDDCNAPDPDASSPDTAADRSET